VDDERRDEMDRVVERSEDLKDRARQVQDRAARAQDRVDPNDPGARRAVEARRHEVETLEQAIAAHEQAAEFQERHVRSDRAAEARARADHDLLEQARAELAKDEGDAA
jgi:hypothetical protein